MIQWIIFTDERAGRPRASKSRQRFLPCKFAAREPQRGDRQICGGRRSPPRPVGDEGGWSRNEAQSA